MPRLTSNMPGECVKGYFYYFTTKVSDEDHARQEELGTIIREGEDACHVPLYSTVSRFKENRLHECPVHPSHISGRELADEEIVVSVQPMCRRGFEDQFKEAFIQDDQLCLVTPWFAEELKKSGLNGAKIVSVRDENRVDGPIPEELRKQEGIEEMWKFLQQQSPPAALAVYFEGRDCTYSRVVPESANRCIYCGFAPIYCYECGTRYDVCPDCGKLMLVLEEDYTPGDRRILLESTITSPWAVDPALWDGSDFVGGGLDGIITHRALQFLIEKNAWPFCATPIRAYIEHLSNEERERLELARQQPRSKGRHSSL